MTTTTQVRPVITIVPPAPAVEPLHSLWEEPIYKLHDMSQETSLSDEEMERHRICAHLLMQIVCWYWNGYKNGRAGSYPLNYVPQPGDPPHLHRDYYGHNIAALAVDKKGYILDFDFNHNDTFVSSAEHAESRLVRRLYSLAQISEAWGALSARTDPRGRSPKDDLGNDKSKKRLTLSDVTIYTTLEACAQCSGTMALAAVPQFVYVQADPFANGISKVLRNLTTGTHRAPRPISGGDIALTAASALDKAFQTFEANKPVFWEPPGGVAKGTNSVTSFLCTAEARQLFRDGGRFESLRYGPYAPFHETHDPARPDICTTACALSNERLLGEAERFLAYAKDQGARGTPHNI